MPHAVHILLLAGLLSGAAQAQSLPSLPPPPPLTAGEIGPYLRAAEAADAIEDGQARCLAYPDLPRIGWPRAVVEARCALQRAPRFSAAELSSKLATRAGRAEVSRAYALLLRQHYEVPGQREQIFLAIEPFKGHASLDAPVAAWVKAEPDNPWARLAQGARLKGAAQESRGTRYIQETAASRLQEARQLAQAAIPHLQRALELEPRLSPACVVHIESARLAGSSHPRDVADRCLAIDPASYHVVVAWYPGLPEAQVQAHLQQYGEQNPLVAGIRTILEGNPYSELPAAALPAAVLPQLKALRHGPNAGMLNRVSAGYYQSGQDDLGLALLSQAVRFDMGYPHYRAMRVSFNRSRRSEWAMIDLRHLLREYPEHPDYAYQLRTEQETVARKARESRAPTSQERELQKFVWDCNTYSRLSEGADADYVANHPRRHCGDEAVARWPDEAAAWLLQAEIRHRYKRPGFEEAARRYLALVKKESLQDDVDIRKVKQWLGEP